MTQGTRDANALVAFARLGRLHFLVGGLAFYALGVAVAAPYGEIHLGPYVWGQAAITLTQLMTQYANEYFDLAADRANETPSPWSGGSRVLPDGLLAPKVALIAALVFAACAVVVDVVIGIHLPNGRVVAPLLLLALAVSWEYSAPPLRLHSRGLGAPTVALVVTFLTPLVGYLLQVPRPILPAVLAAVPLVFAQMAMILVIDFPDAAGDRIAGKRTLAVRIGGRASAWLCILAACAPYLALPVLALYGLPRRTVFAIASNAPMASLLVAALASGDWYRANRWRRLTWLAVTWFALLVAAELLSSLSLAIEVW